MSIPHRHPHTTGVWVVNSRMFPLFLSSWRVCLHNAPTFAGPTHNHQSHDRYLVRVCTSYSMCVPALPDISLTLSLTAHTGTDPQFANLVGDFSQGALFAQGHMISYFHGQILTKPLQNLQN